jgi:acetate kinase
MRVVLFRITLSAIPASYTGPPVTRLGLVGSILVVNAGSTSLKLHLVAADETAVPVDVLEDVDPEQVDAVAHRVVHGGDRFQEPVVVDVDVRAGIAALEPLAPLHNPSALAGVALADRFLPGVPQVAVFDTAFHATMPPEARLYAVPERWRSEWGIRRYGFHGLSVEWSAERAPALLGRGTAGMRLVVCHLGGGCSVTAVRDGRSQDTTMGFSPLEGVPMATRAGSVDSGALLYVLRERGLDTDGLERELNAESGLKGLGGTGDVRELVRRSDEGDERANLALGVFVYRIAGAVAAMAAAVGGLDAVVFTAGIGENSPPIRGRICARLGLLGVELDAARNGELEPDCDIAADGSSVRVLVVRAREELVAARAARALLARR